MDRQVFGRIRPIYADVNETFGEFLIASGIGAKTFKLSDVCMVTTDLLGREVRYVDVEEEIIYEEEWQVIDE